MATDLPTNIDATYADRSPGDAEHQRHHDAIHAYTNEHDTAVDPHGDRAYADSKIASLPTVTGFRAHLSANQALVAATYATVIFNTETLDETGAYNPSSGAWTCPAAGWWLIGAGVGFAAAASVRCLAEVRVNNVPAARFGDVQQNGATPQLVGTFPLHLNAGDVVTVAAYRATAGDVVGSSGATTFFTAARIA